MHAKRTAVRLPDGSLEWEGVSITTLLEDRPTPFFLFSEDRLRQNLAAVREGLGASGLPVEIRYCAKTNSELAVQGVFASEGSSVMASTPEEVDLALAAGFSSDRIAYQRPVIGAEIATVLARGVRRFHIYRNSHVEILERFASEAGVSIAVSLRIRDAKGGMMVLGSAARRLGLTPDEAIEAARSVASSGRLRLDGLNSYIGTHQRGYSRFARSIQLLCSVAARIRRDTGQEVAELNIGGGIPSETLRRMTPSQALRRWFDQMEGPRVTLAGYASEVGSILREEIERVPFVSRVAAEPGRSLVGNAGVLITRVTDVQRDWLFVDASRNVLCESPLLFNRRIDTHTSGRRNPTGRYYSISGCTLNTLDVIDWRRRLPCMERGDVLLIGDAGAYSLSRAARYAGLTPAAYMITREGNITMIRRPETLADLAAPMTGAKVNA